MTPDFYLDSAIEPALSILPSKMGSVEAKAMLLAIALQESRLVYRRQIHGPARGYMMFEPSGVEGVLKHHSTAESATALCRLLDISPTLEGVFQAIEFNDLLCVGFARLNLWTSIQSIPGIDEPARGWHLYTHVWRPGKARPDTWDEHYRRAWATVVPGLERSLTV